MRTLALMAITAYQRFLSPYKGFCCAYRQHTGRKSCSTLGFRAVRRYGVITGVAILRQRTYLCGVTYRRFSPLHQRPHRAQRGDCDVGACDLPCDFSEVKFSDFSSCGDCGSNCDWPSRSQEKNEKEDAIYIPPKN